MLNNPNFGGCGGGGRAHVPMGVDWTRASRTSSATASAASPTSTRSTGQLHRRRAGLDQPHDHHRPRDDQVAPVHRADHAAADRRRRGRELQPGHAAGDLEQQPRRRAVRGRRNAEHRHLPAGRELPDERQRARVLPGLLHLDQDAAATARPATTSGARTPGASSAAARATCCSTTARRSSCSAATGAGFTHTFQRRRARPRLVAVQAQRPDRRRRLQRRRRRRDRHLQRRRLGDAVSRAARLRRRRRAEADRALRRRHPAAGAASRRTTASTPPTSTATARDDLVVFNGDDWSMTYVGLLRSTGSGFFLTNRYDGDIPGWGGLAAPRRVLRRRPERRRPATTSSSSTATTGRMAYVGLFRAGRRGLTHDRALRRRHPRLGRPGARTTG